MEANLGVRLEGHGHFPAAVMSSSTGKGYLILAGEVDHRLPFCYFIESSRKKSLLAMLHREVSTFSSKECEQAALLKAAVIPPGSGGQYFRRRQDAHLARFDVALIIQTSNVESAMSFKNSLACRRLEQLMEDAGSIVYTCVAENPCGLGFVDHSRGGIFLINYFLSSSTELNLWVWQYTAGWFQEQTGLDNSVVMKPLCQTGPTYTLLNHCRWPRLREVLIPLVFKRSFRKYVLGHFNVNETSPMPVLYRIASVRKYTD